MPRDGSGGYSRYTPGTPYVNGTTIDETVVNGEMADIANELASSLAKDGQTVPTNNLPMGGYKHTGVGDGTASNHYAAVGQITKDSFQYGGTAGGTADALAATLSPAPTAYTTGMRVKVKASAANTGATTINLNSLGVKDIKRDVSVALLAGDIPNGGIIYLDYDGTNFQLLNPARVVTQSPGDNSTKEASTAYVDNAVGNAQSQLNIRQTVLSGPVDASGLPDFGGATGTTTVTMSGTLIATAANGFSAAGGVNRIGSITNASWTGLSTNGTMYLYLDIASNGTCTAGSSTSAPVYQWGGTYSTASGQFTFNIQEMVGKVGDGATAAQTYRVYVGQVTVAGNVVTAITWYALLGRYRSTGNTLTDSTPHSANHNIGVSNSLVHITLTNTSTELGYAVGDEVDITSNNIFSAATTTSWRNALSAGFIWVNMPLAHKTTGAGTAVDESKWNWNLYAQRPW